MQIFSVTLLAALATTGGGNGEDNPEIPPFEVAAQIETAYEKGCDVTGTVGRNSFSTGNPCNCDEILDYTWDEASGELHVNNAGGRVAHCNQVESSVSSCSFGALGGINCAVSRDWNCYSSYC
ncbi:hypothetical protein HYQ45_003746 [Verticillium longisporum]|uniref:Uncharacterized protein n=1 Tax=Verticillium longisporum TaxID=100787 RepID=A0A0G4KT41_VERLO|nr:hypothetical protein HYQ45_003746 [Verticillium longisporum]CRK12963.1 hypothetical protein BN1723_009873 [Verticillium longisporum]CRK16249.1 hypothetical protein BN1708_011688 [Verticillium longisporum]